MYFAQVERNMLGTQKRQRHSMSSMMIELQHVVLDARYFLTANYIKTVMGRTSIAKSLESSLLLNDVRQNAKTPWPYQIGESHVENPSYIPFVKFGHSAG